MSIRDRVCDKCVFARSHPATTQQIIDEAQKLDWSQGHLYQAMKEQLLAQYAARYGNSLPMMLAVSFIAPTVVELFMKWWANQEKKN